MRICKWGKWNTWLVALGAGVLLSGCLVPEKFSASVTVKPDGSYQYQYEGSAVHAMAAAALKDKGSLAPKDEDALKREAKKAATAQGVKKFDYVGNGRYNVVIDQMLPAGQSSKLLKVFTVSQDKAGVYTIEAPAISAKEAKELKTLDIKVAGKAEVYLPPNAKVLSSNATSTPGLLSKAYGWKIGSLEDKPSIRFTLTP